MTFRSWMVWLGRDDCLASQGGRLPVPPLLPSLLQLAEVSESLKFASAAADAIARSD